MPKTDTRFRKHTVGTATPLVITVVKVHLVKYNAIVRLEYYLSLESGNPDGTAIH